VANFLVLKPSSGTIPTLGTTSSADVYFGDHVTELAARQAAALKWNLGPNVNLWSVPAGNLTPGTTSVTST